MGEYGRTANGEKQNNTSAELSFAFDRARIYSEEEAAELLGMTIRQLATRRRAGKISCLKDGHFIAYLPDQIIEYCATFRRDRGFIVQGMTGEEMIAALRNFMAGKRKPKRG